MRHQRKNAARKDWTVLLLTAAMLAAGPGVAQQSSRQEIGAQAIEAQAIEAQAIEAIVAAYLRDHPDEVGRIVMDYVARHPESLRGLVLALAARRNGAAPTAAPAGETGQKLAQDRASLIAANADVLFRSSHQTVLGDASGDVTLVEFFDYNCGYCKRAVADMLTLLAGDKKLRVVLKEFPVLGPRSVDLAKVAAAVRMQDAQGGKYQAFHEKLLASREPVSLDKALAVAQDLGLDRGRLEQDMASDETRATLQESARLAAALHISGTPTFVVGDKVLVGAVGLEALKASIASQRAGNQH